MAKKATGKLRTCRFVCGRFREQQNELLWISNFILNRRKSCLIIVLLITDHEKKSGNKFFYQNKKQKANPWSSFEDEYNGASASNRGKEDFHSSGFKSSISSGYGPLSSNSSKFVISSTLHRRDRYFVRWQFLGSFQLYESYQIFTEIMR